MESMFELGFYLLDLGMLFVFDENKVDFFGIDNSKNVYINEVFYKVFVEVNEEGLEVVVVMVMIFGMKFI